MTDLGILLIGAAIFSIGLGGLSIVVRAQIKEKWLAIICSPPFKRYKRLYRARYTANRRAKTGPNRPF